MTKNRWRYLPAEPDFRRSRRQPSATTGKTTGTARVALSNGPTVEVAVGHNDVRRECNQFCRGLPNFSGIRRGIAGVETHVAPVSPA